MSDGDIDLEQISAETGVDYDDVALVLASLCGWGDAGAWLFSSYVDEDQREDIVLAWREVDE